jgi:hypothetical protein
MTRPPHMAARAMQPMATSATKFLKLSFAFMAAYYIISAPNPVTLVYCFGVDSSKQPLSFWRAYIIAFFSHAVQK